ncbi:glutathione S-transferase [Ceratobasidium sp. AG-Ba]|nr:glutathione S-transferase [Ceratobasidium sp. AG-Ba]
MAATRENPIILYDVASKDGSNWSSNTIKTRLTLNYKGIPYRVRWVELHQIESTLKAMGVPPTSKTAPLYTLPTIADPSSEPNGEPTYVAETFTISSYLDEKYPAPKYPTVFPRGTRPLQKTFVEHFAATTGGPLFQSFIRQYFPEKFLSEPALEYLLRSRNVDIKVYAHLQGEEAETKLAEVRRKWDALAETLKLNDNGPFVMGDTMTFADFAVGGMLFALNRVEGDEGKVWQEVMKWSDGQWNKYWKEIKAIKDKSAEVA